MRVLVIWAANADIGEAIAHLLEEGGHDVIAVPARDAPDPRGFDAVIAGSALRANRWRGSARRWVEHHATHLESIPTWMFSSGPAARDVPRDARSLMKRIGAIDHVVLRDRDRASVWAATVESGLGVTRPRPAEELHGHSLVRLFEYGAYGWALCALSYAVLLPLSRPAFAIAIHAISAPLVFGLLARRYQSVDGARTPLATAMLWTAMVAILDAGLLAAVVRPEFSLLASVPAFWLPLALVFVSSWAAGAVTEMLPVTHSDASRAIRA